MCVGGGQPAAAHVRTGFSSFAGSLAAAAAAGWIVERRDLRADVTRLAGDSPMPSNSTRSRLPSSALCSLASSSLMASEMPGASRPRITLTSVVPWREGGEHDGGRRVREEG